tara:strand:+ start:913 stop:1842 length:930 start_codon:yes stop_codon:yes gene_type:complete
MYDFFKLIRVDYWPKNIMVIPGFLIFVLLSGEIDNYLLTNPLNIIISITSILLVCSSNYILNEILDRDYDKHHPEKKNRPMVSGRFTLRFAYFTYLLFSLSSFLFAYLINFNFLITVILLFIMGLIYNVKPIRTKDLPYIDVISESFNNVLRFFLGWFIVDHNYLPPISIVIIFWTSGAFLMTIKRFSEMKASQKMSISKYRKTFSKYTPNKLLLISIFYCILCNLFLGIFLIKYKVELILLFPFIAIIFVHYLSLSLEKNPITQNPEKIFLDKKLISYIITSSLLLLIILIYPVSFLDFFQDTSLILM